MEPTASASPDIVDQDPILLYVPEDTWADTVQYYSLALNQQPNPSGPPEAVFHLAGGKEMRVIATNQGQQLALNPVNFLVELPYTTYFQIAYNAARRAGATPVIPLQTINVSPVFSPSTNSWIPRHITLASVSFRSSLGLVAEDQILGVINHNPNW